MITILYYTLFLLGSGFLLKAVFNVVSDPCFRLLISTLVAIPNFIIGSVIISSIRAYVKSQIEDFYEVIKCDLDKRANKQELKKYMTIIEEILENYKEFRRVVKNNTIKDEKPPLTVLESTGFVKLLNHYCEEIRKYLNCIYDCDRRRTLLIRNLKTRQSRPFLSYSLFIPKQYKLKEEEDLSKQLKKKLYEREHYYASKNGEIQVKYEEQKV